MCKSCRDNITAVSGASVWVNYHPILSTSASLRCLSSGLVAFLSSSPLPLTRMSPSALSLPTEVGFMPTKSASLENFPPHLCVLVCVRVCVAYCPSLLYSSSPLSSPSLSLSPLSISTLVYVSPGKKKKKSAICVEPFMSERDGARWTDTKTRRAETRNYMIDRLMNDRTEHLIVNRLASMSRFFSGLRRLKVLRHTKQPFAHAFIGWPVHQERHSAPRHCYARSFTRRQNSNPACESVNLIQGYFHTQPGDLENGPLTFRLYFLSHSL